MRFLDCESCGMTQGAFDPICSGFTGYIHTAKQPRSDTTAHDNSRYREVFTVNLFPSCFDCSLHYFFLRLHLGPQTRVTLLSLRYSFFFLASSAGLGVALARHLILTSIQDTEHVRWLHALSEEISYLVAVATQSTRSPALGWTSAVRLPSPSNIDWRMASSSICSLLS